MAYCLSRAIGLSKLLSKVARHQFRMMTLTQRDEWLAERTTKETLFSSGFFFCRHRHVVMMIDVPSYTSDMLVGMKEDSRQRINKPDNLKVY